jgi:hypothetical protein
VIYKQADAGWYSMGSFVVAVTLVSIPVALLESVLLGTLIYWLSSFTPTAPHYFFFIFVLFMTSLALSTMFRTVAHLVPSMDVAMTIINPVTGIHMLYGGAISFCTNTPHHVLAHVNEPLRGSCKQISEVLTLPIFHVAFAVLLLQASC